MPKKYKIHKSISFIENGVKTTHVIQVYKVGIYCIVNNDPGMQFSLHPSALVKIEKKLNKKVSEGTITDLQLGSEITVAEVDGFWEEISA